MCHPSTNPVEAIIMISSPRDNMVRLEWVSHFIYRSRYTTTLLVSLCKAGVLHWGKDQTMKKTIS